MKSRAGGGIVRDFLTKFHSNSLRAVMLSDFMMGAHQNSDGTKTGSKKSPDDNVVLADSARVKFELALDQERPTHVQRGPRAGCRLQLVHLLRTMILGVPFSLLHLGMRMTDLQCECDEQTCC